jgi:hypothetical protein
VSFWTPRPRDDDEDEFDDADEDRVEETRVPVAIRFVLARTDDAVVLVDRVVATSDSFSLTLSVRVRTWRAALRESLHMGFTGFQAVNDDEVFRFGVEFANGMRLTNVGSHARYEEDPEAPAIFGTTSESTYDGRGYDDTYTVWPLPPPGPLVFACEWPSEHIAVTLVRIEAATILEAAARSVPIFPAPAV